MSCENKPKATISGGAVFGGGLLGGSAGGAVGYAVCPFTGWFFVDYIYSPCVKSCFKNAIIQHEVLCLSKKEEF
ncbi:hypothetical protein [Helicobacter sp. MIT 99-5507]|uniref:hypothetical protein n=1 Tax=Helicobacter sp. MIT 99-5507 TaxID=152489 RepID=UPI000E1F03C0|nr:hypothetical protein [Helicobacter sp. MIT 99-5507]RDU58627.1 hypothetical protein CQA42_02270 [Helicobacter sp. MIT 99-5507]